MKNRPQPALFALVFLACLTLPVLGAGAQAPFPAGATFELGFSPGGTSTTLVLKAIGKARKSLLIAAYEFTDRDIAEAVEAAAHRGVKVRIVMDSRAARSKYSQLRILVAAGLPIRLDDRHAITHHKFMVIDGVSVQTGSYNYTQSAATANAENALVLWNVPELAARYAEEFERLWAESAPA